MLDVYRQFKVAIIKKISSKDRRFHAEIILALTSLDYNFPDAGYAEEELVLGVVDQ
jgi:hypothetical protein